MSIPVLSSLGSMLSGTVTEELKKLLNAFSMVVAAIFLALHFVLVLPTLRERAVPAVLAVGGWFLYAFVASGRDAALKRLMVPVLARELGEGSPTSRLGIGFWINIVSTNSRPSL